MSVVGGLKLGGRDVAALLRRAKVVTGYSVVGVVDGRVDLFAKSDVNVHGYLKEWLLVGDSIRPQVQPTRRTSYVPH